MAHRLKSSVFGSNLKRNQIDYENRQKSQFSEFIKNPPQHFIVKEKIRIAKLEQTKKPLVQKPVENSTERLNHLCLH